LPQRYSSTLHVQPAVPALPKLFPRAFAQYCLVTEVRTSQSFTELISVLVPLSSSMFHPLHRDDSPERPRHSAADNVSVARFDRPPRTVSPVKTREAGPGPIARACHPKHPSPLPHRPEGHPESVSFVTSQALPHCESCSIMATYLLHNDISFA